MDNDEGSDNNMHDEHFRAFDEIRQRHIEELEEQRRRRHLEGERNLEEMRLADVQRLEQQQPQEARRPRRQRRWWGRRLPRMLNNNNDDNNNDNDNNEQPVPRMIPIPRAENNNNNNNDQPPVARMIRIPRRAENNHNYNNYNNNMIIDLVEQDVIEREPAQPPPPPLVPQRRNQFPNQPEVAGRYAVAVVPAHAPLPRYQGMMDDNEDDHDDGADNGVGVGVGGPLNNNNNGIRGRFAERDRRRADRHIIMHERLRQRRQQRQELLDDVLPPRRVRIRGGERPAAAVVAEAVDDNNNNDDDNNNVPARAEVINLADDDDHDDDDMHDDLMMMDFAGDIGDAVGGVARRHIFGRRLAALRARDNTSSLLFDMVKEGRMCTSVLSGWGRSEQGCNSIVQHCEANIDQANYLSELGRTPIHEACLRGACRHVIQALIAANNHGAMDRDHHGNNPLHLLFVDYSSSTSSTSSSALSNTTSTNIVWSPKDLDEMVGDLLEVNPTAMGSSVNAYGDTPVHAACMFSETMVDPNSIVQLLTANTASASIMNRKNQTPLRLHCERRNASAEVARLLLDANPDALSVLDNESGWAPIHYAASNANFELLRVLVEARPEAVQVRTAQRQTALHLLCQQHTHLSSSHNNRRAIVNNMSTRGGFSEVAAAVGLLLKADPDAIMHQDANNSFTPLHLVCKTEGPRQVPVQVVQLLLRCNPRAAAVPDSEQYLPLHHACEMGSSLEVIQALIEAFPDATKAMTRKQDSALSLACTCNKSVDTVKLLIESNPKALTKWNDYGFAPLHCVCRAHQPRMGIVQALVDACPSCVDIQNNAGETPKHLASSNSGAFAGVLQLLTTTQNKNNQKPPPPGSSSSLSSGILPDTNNQFPPIRSTATSRLFDHSQRENYNKKMATSNKMGNTPCKFKKDTAGKQNKNRETELNKNRHI
jgi:hypothetical protein